MSGNNQQDDSGESPPPAERGNRNNDWKQMTERDLNRLQKSVTDHDAQASVWEIIQDPSPVLFVTGPPNIGNSTALVAAIAHGAQAKVVCVQHTQMAASIHVDFLSKKQNVLKVGFWQGSGQNDKSLAKCDIVYTTYEWVMANDIETTPWFTAARFLVLDEIHGLSMEQELACGKLRLAAKRPKIIMISAYSASRGFEVGRLFLPEAEQGQALDKYVWRLEKLHVQRPTIRSKDIYLHVSEKRETTVLTDSDYWE